MVHVVLKGRKKQEVQGYKFLVSKSMSNVQEKKAKTWYDRNGKRGEIAKSHPFESNDGEKAKAWENIQDDLSPHADKPTKGSRESAREIRKTGTSAYSLMYSVSLASSSSIAAL